MDKFSVVLVSYYITLVSKEVHGAVLKCDFVFFQQPRKKQPRSYVLNLH